MGVKTHDTRLVGLRNVGEDDIDHADQHAVAQRVSGILDDGDDVGAVSRHADQVTAGTVGELDGVDGSSRPDNVRNVADRGTAGGTEIQDLGAGAHVDIIQTTQDTGSELAAEGVPDTVFGLDRGTFAVSGRRFDGDALLAVDRLSGGQVLGDEQVFLSAASDEDTGVTVGFLGRQNVSK